jgi:hypothetical protein
MQKKMIVWMSGFEFAHIAGERVKLRGNLTCTVKDTLSIMLFDGNKQDYLLHGMLSTQRKALLR